MFYEISNSAADVQTTLMDRLKSQGCDVIQTSNGIVVRSQERREQFAQSFKIDVACVKEINPRDTDLTPDVRAFVGS